MDPIVCTGIVKALLRIVGLNPRDFEVTAAATPALIEPIGVEQVVTVRQRSTGDERIYVGGPWSSWFGELAEDLDRQPFVGRAKRPARMVGRRVQAS